MRLLVTRPLPDAEATALRLRAAGHDVIIEPLLRAELLEHADAADPTAIAVTSRNGVRALAAWRQSAGWRDRPVFAVGAATAATATESGFTDVRSADGDGEALARLIATSLDPGATILYPAAEVRSPAMELALRDSGFDVEVSVAYRMIAADRLPEPVVEALRAGAIDGVLLYSRQGAAVFLRLMEESQIVAALRRLTVFVLSSAVAGGLDGIEVGRLVVADTPDEDAMMRAVQGTPAEQVRLNGDG
jgi:uroporphyrinogen-III synthase